VSVELHARNVRVCRRNNARMARRDVFLEIINSVKYALALMKKEWTYALTAKNSLANLQKADR
jgi:hypothetical protein